MYRRILFIALFLLIFAPIHLSAESQIEFVAEITGVDSSGEFTVLTVAITPEVSLQVFVTDQTEIKNGDSGSIGSAQFEIGQTVEIKGIFTDLGLLALEVEISSEGEGFELSGLIDSVGDGEIQVLGLTIQVPPETEISDGDSPIAFSELQEGQFVRVGGTVIAGRLVARRIKVRTPRDRFAPIRFEGLVLELPTPNQMVVGIPGDVRVRVVLTPETEIIGDLAVGVRVRVFGRVGPDLAVIARRVVVLRLLQLVPSRVEMEPESEHRLVVLLGAVFDRDVVVALSSEHPEIAAPREDSVVLPAGQFSAVFHIKSGPEEGRTNILAQLPNDLGALEARSHVQVQTEDDEPDREWEIRWSPDTIRAAPQGEFVAKLHLSRPAPADFRAVIEQVEGDENFVVFPETVLFPAGERTLRVPLQFLLNQGQAVLKATLPEDLGGDADKLEIQIKGFQDVKLRLHWRPEKVEVAPETAVRVILALERPAPVAFRAVLSIPQGNPDLLVGLPSEVVFLAGQQEAVVEFKTAAQEGRLRVRAAAPRSLGGDHTDLQVEIKN